MFLINETVMVKKAVYLLTVRTFVLRRRSDNSDEVLTSEPSVSTLFLLYDYTCNSFWCSYIALKYDKVAVNFIEVASYIHDSTVYRVMWFAERKAQKPHKTSTRADGAPVYSMAGC